MLTKFIGDLQNQKRISKLINDVVTGVLDDIKGLDTTPRTYPDVSPDDARVVGEWGRAYGLEVLYRADDKSMLVFPR